MQPYSRPGRPRRAGRAVLNTVVEVREFDLTADEVERVFPLTRPRRSRMATFFRALGYLCEGIALELEWR